MAAISAGAEIDLQDLREQFDAGLYATPVVDVLPPEQTMYRRSLGVA